MLDRTCKARRLAKARFVCFVLVLNACDRAQRPSMVHPESSSSAVSVVESGDSRDASDAPPRPVSKKAPVSQPQKSWVCKDWEELGERRVVDLALERDEAKRKKARPGAISIQLPKGLSLAPYLESGAPEIDCKPNPFGCSMGYVGLVEPVYPLVPVCGQDVQTQLPRVQAAVVHRFSHDLNDETYVEDLERRMELCMFPLANTHAETQVSVDKIERRDLRFDSSSDGTCELELGGVRAPNHRPDPWHYFVFTRLYRDLKAQTQHAVTVAFIVLEKDWILVEPALKRAAQSLKVDWPRFLERRKILGDFVAR